MPKRKFEPPCNKTLSKFVSKFAIAYAVNSHATHTQLPVLIRERGGYKVIRLECVHIVYISGIEQESHTVTPFRKVAWGCPV